MKLGQTQCGPASLSQQNVTLRKSLSLQAFCSVKNESRQEKQEASAGWRDGSVGQALAVHTEAPEFRLPSPHVNAWHVNIYLKP